MQASKPSIPELRRAAAERSRRRHRRQRGDIRKSAMRCGKCGSVYYLALGACWKCSP